MTINITDDIDALQWIFYTEFMINAFKKPIDCRTLCRTTRTLHAVSQPGASTAEEVLAAWNYFTEAAGPRFAGQFIASGGWKEYVPEPDDTSLDDDSTCTVWSGDGKRVVARVVDVGGKPEAIKYSIE